MSMKIRCSGINTCRCSDVRLTDYDGALDSAFSTIIPGDSDTQKMRGEGERKRENKPG